MHTSNVYICCKPQALCRAAPSPHHPSCLLYSPTPLPSQPPAPAAGPPPQKDKRTQLRSWCEDQLLQWEVENADDIRLSVQLHTKCTRERIKFCSGVQPGGWGAALRGAEILAVVC